MDTIRRYWICVGAITAFLSVGLIAGRQGVCQGAAPDKNEQQLIAILQSDSAEADKALACKHLAVRGTSEAVPELAKLLSNERLASWARIALEAIPGSAADEALRKAGASLQGELLIGVINSIGVRADAAAVDLLTTKLKDSDADVASSAAVALGHIANDIATQTLRQALTASPVKVRSAVAEGCILCAEKRLAEGKAEEAAAIYDEVRKADVPRQRVLEATRGAILARGAEGIPLLLEQLASNDKGSLNIALSTAREFPGAAIDGALAGQLEKSTPAIAALIVQAMADRTETVQVPAILKAATSGAQPVRLAAIQALGRVGNASCVASLLEVAQDADAELAQSARLALASLPDPAVDQEITSRLPTAKGRALGVLIETVGQRRIAAVPALVQALNDGNGAIRSAALTSLGETVSPTDLNVLITQVIKPRNADDVLIAQQALKAAAVRMPDREVCAAELVAAMKGAPEGTQSALLEILGAVGGTRALQAMAAAAKGNNPHLQDVSTRLLGEWMTIDAAPVLLDLVSSAPGEKYQVRAMRGYIRIARQFTMSEPERIAMCEKALAAAKQPAEQKLVLDVARRYPSPGMLKLVVAAMEQPALKNDANEAALAIAQKVGGNAARDLLANAGLERVKVEILKAEYGAGSNQKDVTDIIRKQASDLPLIMLPSASYNEALGGDPAPGVVKQLKIRYRLNGKEGEVAFAENALILLPMPK